MAGTNIQYYTDTRAVYSTSNEDSKIAIGSATGTVEGLELEYDILTTQKNFKISKLGVNYDDGVINNTTSLSRIAEVQNLLQSVQTPPNATTFSLNNTLLLTDGTNSTTFDVNGIDMDVITSGGGHFNFNTLPECSEVPSTNNQFTNKTNVDGKSASTSDITSTNTNGIYYPVFTSSSGLGQILRCDDITGPWQINPNTGVFNFATTIGCSGSGANGSVKFGLNSQLITPGLACVAVGLNAGNNTQGSSAIAVGSSSGLNNQGASSVAIGVNAASNTQGSSAVAVGSSAGRNNQGNNTVAIGTKAGEGTITGMGDNSIAIGNLAGNNTQVANSICINGSGVAVNPANPGTYINPIRNEGGTSFNVNRKNLQYNIGTFELTSVDYVITPNTSAGLDIVGNAALLSGAAGGASGQHLVIKVNGVSYKIALLNP